jgi:hypothetical protein
MFPYFSLAPPFFEIDGHGRTRTANYREPLALNGFTASVLPYRARKLVAPVEIESTHKLFLKQPPLPSWATGPIVLFLRYIPPGLRGFLRHSGALRGRQIGRPGLSTKSTQRLGCGRNRVIRLIRIPHG